MDDRIVGSGQQQGARVHIEQIQGCRAIHTDDATLSGRIQRVDGQLVEAVAVARQRHIRKPGVHGRDADCGNGTLGLVDRTTTIANIKAQISAGRNIVHQRNAGVVTGQRNIDGGQWPLYCQICIGNTGQGQIAARSHAVVTHAAQTNNADVASGRAIHFTKQIRRFVQSHTAAGRRETHNQTPRIERRTE